MQKHLGVSDEEMKLFRSKTKIKKLYFDGAGNLLTKLNPKRICIHALSALSGPVYVANKLLFADVDPNEMRLNRVGCFDVGVRCGGCGRRAFEIKIEDRK